jgi:hypothetical protein
VSIEVTLDVLQKQCSTAIKSLTWFQIAHKSLVAKCNVRIASFNLDQGMGLGTSFSLEHDVHFPLSLHISIAFLFPSFSSIKQRGAAAATTFSFSACDSSSSQPSHNNVQQ